MITRRPAFLLPVVLIVIGLLSLTMAGFLYFVRAEAAAASAERDQLQARLIVESALQELSLLLRESSNDPITWFDNPEIFRHQLVWSPAYEREDDPLLRGELREDLLESGEISPAWRYSIVAPNLDPGSGLPDTMRYGLTPEASKLNLNHASETEIKRLLEDVLTQLQLENWEELADSLLDWIDEDDDPRPMGAERDYYEVPERGYYPKNGPLDTVEELLLIRGFSAAILYGEDTNRNGILDPNEDDADLTFPYYDNADGILDQGLAPYVTVWSREPDASNSENGDSGDEDSGDDKEDDQNDGFSEDQGDEDQGDFDQGDQGFEDDAGGDEQDDEGDEDNDENEDVLAGRIHVATAPERVLRALDGMTAEAAAQIVTLRAEQDAETLQSLDWLTASGAMDAETFSAVQARLTTSAYQFHVEILAYADHLPLFRREEYIVEMRGALMQVLYHRNLSSFGPAWPVNEEAALREQQ